MNSLELFQTYMFDSFYLRICLMYKQLLDEIFVISRIVKIKVGVISQS